MSNTIHNQNSENENLGKLEEEQQLQSSQDNLNAEQEDNPLTHSDDESSDVNEASAAKHAVDSGNNNSALRYTDRNRSTTTRANEATDRNDTNSGGMGVGGGNSTGEIM